MLFVEYFSKQIGGLRYRVGGVKQGRIVQAASVGILRHRPRNTAACTVYKVHRCTQKLNICKTGLIQRQAFRFYWSLLCSGLPVVDITVSFPSQQNFIEVRVIRLYANEDVQKGIEYAAKVWRERHLVQGVPPQLDGSRECSTHLMERYRHGGQKIRRASKAEEELLEEYNTIGEELKQLQERQRLLRNQLFAQVANDKGFQTQKGSKAIISRSSKGFQLRTFIKKEKV